MGSAHKWRLVQVKLVKDTNPGAYAVQVRCIGKQHEGRPMFTLAEGYADLDGEAFIAYYCDSCANPLLARQRVGGTIGTLRNI
jgi:hypothetical protein